MTNSHSISLFQNQYGSDEDLPADLKPKLQGPDETFNRISSVGAGKGRRCRKNRCVQILQWLQWICRFERRKTPPDQNFQYIDSCLNPQQYKKKPCRLSFLFDPAGRFIYIWSMVVSIAFTYNLWIVGYRYAFDEIRPGNLVLWFCLDYVADFIYLIDIMIAFRTAFIKEGVLQTNFFVIRQHYSNSLRFYVDCFSLLPFDFLYLSFGFNSLLRCIRLLKAYKMVEFLDSTERHTNNPTAVKALILVHHLLLVLHWNACLLHIFRDDFRWKDQVNLPANSSIVAQYLIMYTHSCQSVMLMHNLEAVSPESRMSLLVILVEQVGGLLLMATVFGSVTNIVTQLGAAKKHFQAELDGVKNYMHRCNVPPYLELKVIRWFDYIWHSNRAGPDSCVLKCLPQKLQGEIAIQVHLDTLKRVEIFRNTEPGFLCDLVLRLTHLLFSPGDYVCRKGEVGKEMYIVREGRLHVVSDDGLGILAILSAGHYFGEISLLNLSAEGNRRTASVISCGYCELLCLSQKDMWEVLEDYPNARHRMEQIANRRLQEQKISNVKNSLLKASSPHRRTSYSCQTTPSEKEGVHRHVVVQSDILEESSEPKEL